MERFEKVLNPLVILFGVIIVLIIKLEQSKQEIMRLKEQQPVIFYQVDNEGTEKFGKVTAKDVVDGHYYVEVKPYGKFLVTKAQYEEIEIGQEMPEYLKGRGD
ncbi:DUF1372 family protein [Streptococcus suis]|uniref:DUF1372 family protein n=1 Tax=Streptococcus suis TaxID=1307 RepID=UPI00069ABBCB|nr:DUF1372 family protein [Streptococcus suis]NQO18570.1 DUF1372 family protein [Streptococcus suis]NQO22680.1 DUF1372 family protein [Streptococcus suis]CYV07811.1 phage protein [Streptococcus suis]